MMTKTQTALFVVAHTRAHSLSGQWDFLIRVIQDVRINPTALRGRDDLGIRQAGRQAGAGWRWSNYVNRGGGGGRRRGRGARVLVFCMAKKKIPERQFIHHASPTLLYVGGGELFPQERSADGRPVAPLLSATRIWLKNVFPYPVGCYPRLAWSGHFLRPISVSLSSQSHNPMVRVPS